jgi:nicotinamidase-related amidase
MTIKTGVDALLAPERSALLLIDHQPFQFSNLHSHEPITWIAVMSEWQRDWAREATIPAVAEITVAHGGASGVAFAWEQQLLNSGRK